MYFRFGRSKKFDNEYLLNFKTDEITDNISHGIHMNDIVGENVQKFDLLYVDDSDGKFYKADATDMNKFPAVAMATEDIEEDNIGRLLLMGYIRSDSEINLDPGKLLYLDINGIYTANYPRLTRRKQIIGYTLSPHIIYFNPDLTFDYHKIMEIDTSETFNLPKEDGVEYFIECENKDVTIQLYKPGEDEVGFVHSFVKLGNGKVTILSSPEIYLASNELNSRIINETFERYAILSLKVVSPDRYVVNSFDGTWAVYGPNE